MARRRRRWQLSAQWTAPQNYGVLGEIKRI
jgi:hypothetical protein